VWTGFKDKVGGNGCGVADDNAICYTVLPTATGGDGAAVIAAGTTYFWEFDVTFAAGTDLTKALGGDHSIKLLSVKDQNNDGNWSTGNQLSQSGAFTNDTPSPPPIPEPISIALLGVGFLALGIARRGSAKR